MPSGTASSQLVGPQSASWPSTTDGYDGHVTTAGVALDAHGNVYGTTAKGGDFFDVDGYGYGVAFKITP